MLAFLFVLALLYIYFYRDTCGRIWDVMQRCDLDFRFSFLQSIIGNFIAKGRLFIFMSDYCAKLNGKLST